MSESWFYDRLTFPVNAKQRARISETETELRDYWDMDSVTTPDIAAREETRVGRGHDLVCWWGNGEMVATLYVDPYGNGPLVVGYYTNIHNDADDDCRCQRCAEEPHHA